MAKYPFTGKLYNASTDWRSTNIEMLFEKVEDYVKNSEYYKQLMNMRCKASK